jgi:RimJ/RimL family protein N-acetyltransferase
MLNLRRLGITQSAGNVASRRVIEKLGFIPEGIQLQANLLPDGRVEDRLLYARLDADNLPDLSVQWSGDL